MNDPGPIPDRDAEHRSSDVNARDVFATTHWSVVLNAARNDTTTAREALATLCQTYWRPLYIYARHRGYSAPDAEDLVQGFFERFLAKNRLEGVTSGKGRFRAFLLASLKNFLATEWERAQRQKRGGQFTHFSLDWMLAEDRYLQGEANDLSPDRAYDREWALTLLDRVLHRLRDECAAEGKSDRFDRLKPFLTASSEEISYREIAEQLAVEEGAARVAVHRLRKRYRVLVRETIAETLSTSEQVNDEMASLFAALRG